MQIKPFVKWAGGKTRLASTLDKLLPHAGKCRPFVYVEPFVGGGAMLLHMLQKYPDLEKVVINDINRDLMNVYSVVKDHVAELVGALSSAQGEYDAKENEEQKREFFNAARDRFNEASKNYRNWDKGEEITQAALFITLNRLCFNGLYRVNKSGEFNVPFGKYDKPVICDSTNLCSVSKLLEKVEVLSGGFEATAKYASFASFYYLDPPDKPVSETSNFTMYHKANFGGNEQERLAEFCAKLTKAKARWMQSNSNCAEYFQGLYPECRIVPVQSARSINSDTAKRGAVTEIVIRNYPDIEYADPIPEPAADVAQAIVEQQITEETHAPQPNA